MGLSWLMGPNPRLDEELPVLYTQQLLSREVLGAAEAFVDDTHARVTESLAQPLFACDGMRSKVPACSESGTGRHVLPL